MKLKSISILTLMATAVMTATANMAQYQYGTIKKTPPNDWLELSNFDKMLILTIDFTNVQTSKLPLASVNQYAGIFFSVDKTTDNFIIVLTFFLYLYLLLNIIWWFIKVSAIFDLFISETDEMERP